MQNTGTQTTGLSLELFHTQTNTSFELPANFTVLRIGKPKDHVIPDINVASLPNVNFVSRLHAEIHLEDNTYYVVDMGSANGTFLNNVRLIPTKRYKLKLGDKIDLGSLNYVTFIFLNQQNLAPQLDTVLNSSRTVLQVELFAETKPSLSKRLSKVAGLILMIAGIVILSANIHIGISVRLGVLLCTVAVAVLSWRRFHQNLGWLLLGFGISVMLFTDKAFAPVPLLFMLAGCALIIAGYRLYSR